MRRAREAAAANARDELVALNSSIDGTGHMAKASTSYERAMNAIAMRDAEEQTAPSNRVTLDAHIHLLTGAAGKWAAELDQHIIPEMERDIMSPSTPHASGLYENIQAKKQEVNDIHRALDAWHLHITKDKT